MRNTITRATIAGLAALSLMGSLVATSEPAAAGGHGGSFTAAGSTAAVGMAAGGMAAVGMGRVARRRLA